MPTPKMTREALCVAQSALAERARQGMDADRVPTFIAYIGELIAEIDKHRPLGTGGKHGNLHTPTCGCPGHDAPWTITIGAEHG